MTVAEPPKILESNCNFNFISAVKYEVETNLVQSLVGMK
jgi:hypothetical protein